MIPRPLHRAALLLRRQAVSARSVSAAGRGLPAPGRRSLLLASAFACALLAAPVLAHTNDGTGPGEYEIKAAFLHKFTKYVTWPEKAFERSDSPLIIAVVGRDPFGSILDETLRDKVAGTHPIEVHRFRSVRELGRCHMLFVPASEALRGREIAAHYRGTSTLIVGESEGFARKGGTINFFLEGKRLRFEINTDAVERVGVDISSQLLKHARIVRDEEDDH
jgi:hypothetical protein